MKSILVYANISYLVQEQIVTRLNAAKSNNQPIVENTTHDEFQLDPT